MRKKKGESQDSRKDLESLKGIGEEIKEGVKGEKKKEKRE